MEVKSNKDGAVPGSIVGLALEQTIQIKIMVAFTSILCHKLIVSFIHLMLLMHFNLVDATVALFVLLSLSHDWPEGKRRLFVSRKFIWRYLLSKLDFNIR